MQKVRIIPVVLQKNGRVVQSKGFRRHQVLGNPATVVWRLTNWFSDELVYLDISREQHYDLRRDDLKYQSLTNIIEIVDAVSKRCFMPLTVGGGIRTIQDARDRLAAGADKIAVNTQAHREPEFIRSCAREFGSQCVVVSIDALRKEEGGWQVAVDCGREPTGLSPADWARQVQELGAGEILLNSVDNDGKGEGYDLELIASVVDSVTIPVIAMGGVGEWQHLAEAIDQARPSAVAASNIFQYTENSVFQANSFLYERGYPVRKPMVRSMILEGGI